MKKMMNKAMAAMMMMALAMAMPAKADNRGHVVDNGRRNHVVVVDNHKKDAHFDKKDHKPGHIDTTQNRNRGAYRSTCPSSSARQRTPRCSSRWQSLQSSSRLSQFSVTAGSLTFSGVSLIL